MERIGQSPLARYRQYLERGELAYQFDTAAGAPIFHPRLIGPRSGNANLEWRVSAGLGTVHATTVNHPRDMAPYNVALVDLDEGFRMMTRVEGIAPGLVKVGMRVRLRVRPAAGGESPLPVFVPEETAR
jgi:uncharacterized protein